MRNKILVLTAVAALMAAGPASAHPKLLSAMPAPNAIAKAPATLKLKFSESLISRFSGATVVMTDMPGMKMTKPMAIATQASLGTGAKTLIIALAKPLARGTYRVDWHVVSTDTHRVKGAYVFKVG